MAFCSTVSAEIAGLDRQDADNRHTTLGDENTLARARHAVHEG